MNFDISEAVEHHDLPMVEYLLESGVNPNSTTTWLEPIIITAAANHDYDILELLLKYGANTNATNLGMSALLFSAQYGFADNVKLLLKYGANPNREDHKLETPLFKASYRGFTDIVYILLYDNNGSPAILVDPNIANDSGTTPLIAAVYKNRIDIVNLLLNYKNFPIDDIDYRNDDGWTALYAATIIGSTDLVDILLKYGADPNVPDEQNISPLILAFQRNYSDIISLLLRSDRINLDSEILRKYIIKSDDFYLQLLYSLYDPYIFSLNNEFMKINDPHKLHDFFRDIFELEEKWDICIILNILLKGLDKHPDLLLYNVLYEKLLNMAKKRIIKAADASNQKRLINEDIAFYILQQQCGKLKNN